MKLKLGHCYMTKLSTVPTMVMGYTAYEIDGEKIVWTLAGNHHRQSDGRIVMAYMHHDEKGDIEIVKYVNESAAIGDLVREVPVPNYWSGLYANSLRTDKYRI
jgi:hypothetical protein